MLLLCHGMIDEPHSVFRCNTTCFVDALLSSYARNISQSIECLVSTLTIYRTINGSTGSACYRSRQETCLADDYQRSVHPTALVPPPASRKPSLPAHRNQSLAHQPAIYFWLGPIDVTSTSGSETALSARLRVLVPSPLRWAETMRLYNLQHKH